MAHNNNQQNSCNNATITPIFTKINVNLNLNVSVGKNAEPQGEMVPPDGGWGWFVLFAAVMVNVLIPGGIKSFGVIYKAFLEKYSANSSSGAWIPALCYFLYSSLGIYNASFRSFCYWSSFVSDTTIY